MKQIKFLIALFFVIPSVYAAPITLESTWSVWKIIGPNTEGLVHKDDVVSMSITLELSTPDTNPEDFRGEYVGAITSATLTTGTSIFSGSGSAKTFAAPSAYVFSQNINFYGPNGAGPFVFTAASDLFRQLSDSLLWMSNPRRVDASYGAFSVADASVGLQQIGHFQVVSTPIPAGFWLFSSGVIGLICVRRKPKL